MGTIPSRLVKEISARVGADRVGESGDGALITVGTERDLAGLSGLTMAVAVDPDALIHGQNYRSSEEALRILARLVGSVGRSRGYRTILQTSDPGSALIAALRRGEPIPYLEEILAGRARDGFPPASEMMAIEARGVEPDVVSAALRELAAGMVMGPVESNDRHRWLLQGDLQHVKQEMRKTLQKLRDGGATIRVDADPIDL
jgi:primosomal protein N'